jgi:hypothetical protein
VLLGGGLIAYALLRSDGDADGGSSSGMSIVRVDEPWSCNGPVDLDLVKVTIRNVHTDAIQLGRGCTGTIRRIEVETSSRDGVKVSAVENGPHDIEIGGGYVRCLGKTSPEVHQDGIQVMGGERITFRDLEISCSSGPNGQLFINAVHSGLPTDVVCESCTFGAGAASTLIVGRSVRSGARDSLVCEGRYHDVRVTDRAVDAVNEGNTLLPRSDGRCTLRA